MPRQSNDPNPTQEQIARRAYEIFEQRGRPEGCDLEHWLEAERQLRAQPQWRAEGRPDAQPEAAPSKGPRRAASRQAAGARA
jgi:hypothetical protein